MRTITAEDITALLATFGHSYPGFRLMAKPTQSTRCTTWGTDVYVPATWRTFAPQAQYVRLRHEEVHLQQFQRLGLWRFGIQYLWPSQRFLLEREAFTAEMDAVCEVSGPDVLRANRARYIAALSGTDYYWCASVRAATLWVDRVLSVVIEREGQAPPA